MAGHVSGRLAWLGTALYAGREASRGWFAFAGRVVESVELS